MTKTDRILNKVTASKPLLYLCAALLSAGFGVFVILTARKVNVDYPLLTAVIFGGFFFMAQAILIAQDRFDAITLLVGAACLACVIFARVSLLYFESTDYKAFLSRWVADLGELSVRDALRTPIGDYNLPYIYILLIFSRLDIHPLLAIKSLSCLFDVIMAWLVMKLVMHGVEDRRLQMSSFVLAMAAPTVMINSARGPSVTPSTPASACCPCWRLCAKREISVPLHGRWPSASSCRRCSFCPLWVWLFSWAR